MKILYVNVIECNAEWGAEVFVDKGFRNLGYTTHCIYYRKHRNRLHYLFTELPEHDVFLLQRGDYFPIDLIKSVQFPRFFWASELVSRCRDQDRLLSSGLFDHIFFLTKKYIDTAVSYGWVKRDKCSVLLSGFDETIHRKQHDIKRDIDILFAGSITPRRKKLLEKLRFGFNVTIVNAFGKELVNLFNRSKIVLNMDYEDTETRVFETLGCGSFLLTERLSEENPFINNKHIIEFNDFDELCDKAEFFLRLYFSKGLLQEAENHFKKAISLDTNYKEAIQNLEKVHLKQSKFSVCHVKSPQQKQSSQLRINLIGAFGNKWGAEYHVLDAFKELGHYVSLYDHRKEEATLAIGNDADISIVLKGDGIPPEVIKQLSKPTVLWYGELIHQSPSLADEVSKQKTKELSYNLNSFDIVFHHDYTALEMIKNLGAKNVFWLSNSGVNPKIHRKLNVPKLYDVGFTGTLSPRRVDMLKFLSQKGIMVNFLQVFGEELNLFINQCRIFINLHFSELLNTETRLHEILGAGTFALTEEISMPSMYIDGKHLIYWKLHAFEDLTNKILFYLQNDKERERIALNGHLMVHENYKYTDRCRKLLDIVNQNYKTHLPYHAIEEHIVRAFIKFEQNGGKFEGWALSKNAIRSFAIHVIKTNPKPNIIELGGGQSTLFWAFLIQTENVSIKISTFEHQENWSEQLKRAVAHCKAIEVNCYNLRQINDNEWNTIFAFPESAKTTWSQMGTYVAQSEFENTRIKNTFYDIPPQAFPPRASIDGMIVDGPHGNGRSLAFPLFFDCLKPNAWMLIDDFDHYPFLDDLSKVFKFKLVEKKHENNGKSWTLVRLEGNTGIS